MQFILRHERARHTLHFASLQGPAGVALFRRRPDLATVDSLIWYEPQTDERAERALVRSAAVLSIATYLGGPWHLLGRLASLVPRAIRDAAYDLLARNRKGLGSTACVLPTAAQLSRFTDLDQGA